MAINRVQYCVYKDVRMMGVIVDSKQFPDFRHFGTIYKCAVRRTVKTVLLCVVI
jgi:hypothetical protein